MTEPRAEGEVPTFQCHKYSQLRLDTAKHDLLAWLWRIRHDMPVNLFNPSTDEDGPDSDLHIEAGLLRAIVQEEPARLLAAANSELAAERKRADEAEQRYTNLRAAVDKFEEETGLCVT